MHTRTSLSAILRSLTTYCLAIGFLAAPEVGASFTAVVVYGDSLSDNGNLYSAAGFPTPPYYQGRRSDGLVAVEYLAAGLGAPLVDFAWIGATTGTGNYADGGTVTSFGGAGLPGMRTVYDSTKGSLAPYLPDALFVVWGGPNDILAPSPLDTDPAAIIGRAVANQLAIVTDLQSRGASSILVPGMPDLGLTPYFQSLGSAGAAQGTAFAGAFNLQLQALLPTDVLYVDTAALLRSVVANPSAYGLVNATDACFTGAAVCANPGDYVFFDSFHPTTATHRILASEFGLALGIPEPSTIFLLGVGLFGTRLLRRWVV